MSFGIFLLSIALWAATFNADYVNGSCPYSGEKSQDVVNKLYSERFRNSLSPFNKLLLESIPSEDFFFKLFDTSFKNGTVKKTFFLNCVYWEVQMGLECPIDLCRAMAEKVEKAFEKNPSPIDYFIIVSSTLESSLKQENKLKNTMDENATKRIIRSFLRRVSKYLCSPEVKGPVESLFALDDGSIDFFRSIGATDKKDVAYVATSFGNQFQKFASKSPMESCPYNGEMPKDLVDKLHSAKFRDSLSPFSKLYLNAIPSDDFFFKLFDTSFKNGTVKKTFFLNCVYFEVKIGVDCPVDICKTLGENTAKAFENNLSPLDYFIVCAKNLEDTLKQENKLANTVNSSADRELIASYIQHVSEHLCTSDVEGPVESLFALDDGTIEFLKSIGAAGKKAATDAATALSSKFSEFATKSSVPSCLYSGEKPKPLVDELHSEEFRSSLSPFNKLFLKIVPSDDFFFKLFDVSFQNGSIEDTFFLSCVYWEDKMGLDCPIDLCKTMAKKVAKAFENNLSPLDYFLVVSSALESSLMQEDKTKNTMDEDSTNANIVSFLRYVSKYLCSPGVKGPVASLFALDDGSMDFYRSIGATNPKDLAFVATSFGDHFAQIGQNKMYS